MGWDASTEDPHPLPKLGFLEPHSGEPGSTASILAPKAEGILNTDHKPKLFILERGGRDGLKTVFIQFECVVKGLR